MHDFLDDEKTLFDQDPTDAQDPFDLSLGDFQTLHASSENRSFSFQKGDKIGNYTIISSIAKGGMGEVYRVSHKQTGQSFALKALLPEFLDNDIIKNRFETEARVMSKLSHSNIVKVHDYADIQGRPYMIMDLVQNNEGQPHSLEELCNKLGRLAEDLIHDYFHQLCNAVAYLHHYNGAGIIHRDLKPANILIDKQGNLVITDFGLVKINGPELKKDLALIDISIDYDLSLGDMNTMQDGKQSDIDLTMEGSVLGTYEYMAPEIMDGKEANIQSDIYAIGTILYKMLTGEMPRGYFKAPSFYGCSNAWDNLVEKALNIDLTIRPGLMAELTFLHDQSFRQAEEEILQKVNKKKMLINFSTLVIISIYLAISYYQPFRSHIEARQLSEMNLLPFTSGSFIMGVQTKNMMSHTAPALFQAESNPVHTVTISDPFWLADREVSQKFFQKIMNYNPSFRKGDLLPVDRVSWIEAMEFCRRLTEEAQANGSIPEDYIYSLPTEAQWEYACRGGQVQVQPKQHPQKSWSKGTSKDKAHEVCTKLPSKSGLYDIFGNVSEWCLDGFHQLKAESETDPLKDNPTHKVSKGGSFLSPSHLSVFSSRESIKNEGRVIGQGFRVCLLEADSKIEALALSASKRFDSLYEELQEQKWATAFKEGKGQILSYLDTSFIQIKPGSFLMGSDSIKKYNDILKKKVYITEGFWLSQYEVTQLEYEQIMKENPSPRKKDQAPVMGVTWEQAMQFCKKLTEYERSANQLLDGYIYTLPTEAQWEYACRAGIERYGSSKMSKMTKYSRALIKVGQGVKSNPWGLYNMLDSVPEWCLDWYAAYPQGDSRIDPTGASEGEEKIYRGEYMTYSKTCPGKRHSLSPSLPSNEEKLIGFRICLSKEVALKL